MTSSVPVTAYDVFPFGANSHFPAAELLYPSSAWGTNYVVLATPQGTLSPSRLEYADIVAYEDGTSVTFSPSVALPGGGSYAAVAPNGSTTFTLDAGEYAHWETSPSSLDLSGSIVLATKPVSVTAGNDLFRLQPFAEPGDATRTQIAPVSALGFDYAVSYTTRRADLQEESIYYRIVGVVDGTTLTYDPPAAARRLPRRSRRSPTSRWSAPSGCRVRTRIIHSRSRRSCPPATSTSSTEDVPPDCATIQYLTEPKACATGLRAAHPPTQFLSEYVFFTDPTYSTTTLDLVAAPERTARSRT